MGIIFIKLVIEIVNETILMIASIYLANAYFCEGNRIFIILGSEKFDNDYLREFYPEDKSYKL